MNNKVAVWEMRVEKDNNCFRYATAQCSHCQTYFVNGRPKEHYQTEICGGFFPGFSDSVVRHVLEGNSEQVSLDNYCRNCGCKMIGRVWK